MWIDADAYFNIYKNNIADEIEPNKEIYMVNHFCELHKGSRYPNTKLSVLRINTGVLLLKNSQSNLKFLQNVWNNEKYINHQWWEQAAIMDEIGLKAELTGNLNDHKGNSYSHKIKFLPNEWNSIPSNQKLSMEKHYPIIIHLAGMKFKDRLKFVKNKKL